MTITLQHRFTQSAEPRLILPLERVAGSAGTERKDAAPPARTTEERCLNAFGESGRKTLIETQRQIELTYQEALRQKFACERGQLRRDLRADTADDRRRDASPGIVPEVLKAHTNKEAIHNRSTFRWIVAMLIAIVALFVAIRQGGTGERQLGVAKQQASAETTALFKLTK